MALDSALITRLRTLGAALETTTGTPAALTSASTAMTVYNPTIEAQIPPGEREMQGSLSPLAPVPGAQSGTAKFQSEVTGTGTVGSYPQWASTLLLACGFQSAVAGAYTPLSGAGQTATVGLYTAGRFSQIAGAMGKVSFDFKSGEIVKSNWEFQGVWQPPSETPLVQPTLLAVSPPIFAGGAFTLGGTSYRITGGTLNVENTLAMREDATLATGFYGACIVNRKITFEMDLEAQSLAVQNWFTGHMAADKYILSLAVGATAGNIVTFTAPALQILDAPDEMDVKGIQYDKLTFVHTGTAVDNELSIDFS